MFDHMWLYVTERCNLRCPYCFNPSEIFTRGTTITTEAYRDIVDNFLMYHREGGSTSIPQIVLFGGEPTLFPDVMDGIMNHARTVSGGRVRFLVITNGTRLSKMAASVIAWRKRHHLAFQLSIDGAPDRPSPRTAGINPARYQSDIGAALRLLVDQEVPFTIRSTLTPEYVDEYAHTYKSLVSIGGASRSARSSLTIMPDFVRAKWGDREYRSLREQAEEIVRYVRGELYEHDRLLKEVFVSRAWRTLSNRERGLTHQLRGSVCGFSRGLCAVGPRGDIFACHRLYGEPLFHLGNMRAGRLDHGKREAICQVVNCRAFLRPARELGFETCEECDIRHYCAAVCPAESIVANGAQPELRCNPVLHHFQRIFTDIVARELWPSGVSSNDHDRRVRRRIDRAIGMRPDDGWKAA